jgi:hypothetical protein
MVFELRETSGDIPAAAHDLQQNEPDLKPEDTHYRDEGCVYAAACLDCPYPDCLYDQPRGRQRWLKDIRNRDIHKFHEKGWDYSELALFFGVSARTIQRVINQDKTRNDNRKMRRKKHDERNIDSAAGADGLGEA